MEKVRYLNDGESTNPLTLGYIMSERAYAFLNYSLEQAEGRLKGIKSSLGEVGGTSDWHDNPALDETHRQVDLWASIIIRKLNLLENVVLIRPRIKTNGVGFGNRIVLTFGENVQEETFLMLGPVDATFWKDCISHETPVGKRIMGLATGKTIQVDVEGEHTLLKIVEILPGDF